MEFRIGDIVKPASGGPEMIINYIIGYDLPKDAYILYAPGILRGAVICEWINDDGNVQGGVFNPEELQLIDITSPN